MKGDGERGLVVTSVLVLIGIVVVIGVSVASVGAPVSDTLTGTGGSVVVVVVA